MVPVSFWFSLVRETLRCVDVLAGHVGGNLSCIDTVETVPTQKLFEDRAQAVNASTAAAF
jgi:hypothetical protein